MSRKESARTNSKLPILLTALILMIATASGCCAWQWHDSAARRFAAGLGSGMNIGNSLDAHRDGVYGLATETAWGNPKIRVELFQAIHDMGFQTVRLPVTWENHLDEEGTISSLWLDRVQEVVDAALSCDLYVILNTHHEQWLSLDVDRTEELEARFSNLWGQIAERFADYPSKLLFEGMNEPRLQDSDLEWTNGTPQLREMVDRLNRAFVRTVRESGRENRTRYCLITTYASQTDAEAFSGLTIPDHYCLISLHAYYPYSFCQDKEGTSQWDRFWQQDMEDMFAQVKKSAGKTPVIITEFACRDKSNLEEREKWTQAYLAAAAEFDIPCIWWDNGSDYALINRKTGEWRFPSIAQILTSTP